MKKNGFTLIEALIALICFAGLSLFGVISASFLKYNHERQVIISEIKAAIQYAKMQAITRSSPLYLTSLDQSHNWSNGMKLVQYNSAKNTVELLYQWEWHHPRWNITWNGVRSLNKIILSNNPISAMSNGKFVVFNAHTKEQVVIVLNRLGRVNITSE
jgi:type IV fimbrial biogenesis protein FimT